MNVSRLSWAGLGTITACLVSVLVLNADAPRGWHLSGSKPADYDSGVDIAEAHEGQHTAFLKSKGTTAAGFGTLMQNISAENYKGNKVRLSGLVKAEDVSGWAGIWMRVDRGTQMLVLDNMRNRAIKGTKGWQRCFVVLDVPKDATKIAFGVLLSGPGQVWLNDAKLETVDAAEASTATVQTQEEVLPESPVNLQFLQ
jgi:hypothetical protein